MSEVIASHAVLGLEVSDHGLDRSTPLGLAFDLRCKATLLAGGVDLESVTGRRIVASISGIGEGPLDGVAGHLLHGRNDGAEGVAVVGIAGQRRRMGDELAAA